MIVVAVSLEHSNVIWKEIKMETRRESCSGHTLNPHSMCCPTYVCQILPLPGTHIHTKVHTNNKYVYSRCMQKISTCIHLGKCMYLAHHPKIHTRTHAHIEKHTSFHCITLQAPASADSANPICCNNCHTGKRQECFSPQICKELHSYHSSHSDGNALVYAAL